MGWESFGLPVMGGLINTIAGVFGGSSGGGMSTKKRKELIDYQQEKSKELMGLSNDFSREMYEMQSEDEKERMGLQFNYNKMTGDYNQQLAKDMWEYTGYENQKRQMEEAGLNPGLMYGQGGGGGQSTSGGAMQGVTALQPMGLQVALQAKAQDAQIQLAQAQAEKIITETNQMRTIDIAQKIAGLVQTVVSTGLTATQKKKTTAEIEQLGKSIEQINANIESVRENTELVKFQNRINKILENSFSYEADGKYYDFQDVIISKFYKEFLTNNIRMDKEIVELLNQKGIAERLAKDLDAIVQGKRNELSLTEKSLELKTTELERARYELKNDKAVGDILEEIGTDSKYSKLLTAIIKYFTTKK